MTLKPEDRLTDELVPAQFTTDHGEALGEGWAIRFMDGEMVAELDAHQLAVARRIDPDLYLSVMRLLYAIDDRQVTVTA